MSQPPKRWWTTEDVEANPGKFPKVNAEGDGFEFVTGGGGGDTIYTADGVIEGNRIVDTDGKTLFIGEDKVYVNINPGGDGSVDIGGQAGASFNFGAVDSSDDKINIDSSAHTASFKIANYSAATNNDVLTLIDKTTGQVEFQPVGSGSSYLSQAFGAATVTSSASVRYATFGVATISTTENQRQTIIPVAGTITSLSVRMSNVALSGGQLYAQLRINGADVGNPIPFNLSDGSITTNTASLSDPVSVGDLLAVAIFNDTGTAGSLYSIAIIIS